MKKHAEKEPEMLTIAQGEFRRGKAEGEKRGEKRGERRGEKLGAERVLRDALKRLVTTRFKQVPPKLDALLDGASESTLEKWFEAALTAKSAKAVFAER